MEFSYFSGLDIGGLLRVEFLKMDRKCRPKRNSGRFYNIITNFIFSKGGCQIRRIGLSYTSHDKRMD